MKEILKKRKTELVWAESFLLIAALLGVIYIKCGVYFETNDDRFINEILTGASTGRPDGHAIYVNYLLGSFLAFLYSVAGNISWYGLFLMISHFVVYWSFTGLLLERCETVFQHLLAVGCSVFLVLTNLYIFGEIQYTSTAAILAAGGYFRLIADTRRKRGIFWFGVFELLALLLRSESMLMVQLIGGTVYGVGLLGDLLTKRQEWKDIWQAVLKYCGILISCFIIAALGNYGLGDYGNEQWNAYDQFKLSREIADYYGFPDYGEVKDILDTYNVSQNEYVAFIRNWMVGNEVDSACLEELYEVAKEKHQTTRSDIGEILKGIWESRQETDIAGYGEYTKIVYVFVLGFIILQKKWSAVLPVAGLSISRNLVLGYLIYRGRLPFRVLSGLYFIELLFLLGWLFLLAKDVQGTKRIKELVAGIAVLAMMAFCINTVRSTYYHLCHVHQSREIYSLGMDEIIDYCSGSDAGFIIVNEATTYYTGEALNTGWYHPERNWISSGGWWYGSPNSKAYQEAYCEANQGKMRLIEMGQGMDPGVSFAKELVTVDWGLGLNFVEELRLSNGVVLEVYDIVGK